MTYNDEDEDLEGNQPPPLPQLNWYVNLCSGTKFVKTDITHPPFDEYPQIDPYYENVSCEPLPSWNWVLSLSLTMFMLS